MADLVLRLGEARLTLLDCGTFRYDGGVIFGAVSRADWATVSPPDAQHMVPIGLRPLLIEDDRSVTLVDTGLPERDPGLDFDPPGYRPVTRVLAERGVSPEAVDYVVLTHFHPDHIGCNLREGRATFPNARYVLQRSEAAAAAYPNERTGADYDSGQLAQLQATDRLELVAGDQDITEAVRVVHAPGHTEGHQVVLVRGGGEAALYVSDLAIVPVQAERLAWISALDVWPLQTIESRRRILGQAVADEWLILFAHEPDDTRAVGYLRQAERQWRFEPAPERLTP